MAISFGARFRALRKRAGLTQEQVAKRLGYKRPAPVSLIERPSDKVPRAKTIVLYANALECHPRDLLEDVETEYDRIRAGSYQAGVKEIVTVAKKKLGEGKPPSKKRRRLG